MAEENPQGGQDKIEGLQKLLAKKDGDAMAVAALLYGETHDLREKVRTLKAQLPADGSVILKKEDADRLAAFDALNLKPEEITKKIEGVTTLETENVSLKKDTQLRSVAEAGWKHSVLKDFDTLEGGLEYLVKDETKEGKTFKVAYVMVGGKERPLEEYAKEKRPDLLPAMQAGASQAGTTWVKQDAGSKAPAGSVFDKVRKDAENRDKAKKDTNIPLADRKGLTVIGSAA